jgi:hypothetical protein
MSLVGQTRLGRVGSRSGNVGYPPIATGFSGAANDVKCQQATFKMKEAANLGGLGVEDAVSKSRRGLPLITILMGLQQRP